MAASYAFGVIMGTAYSYGLGQYVLGGSADDMDSVEGAVVNITTKFNRHCRLFYN